jgi:hypothetical protein
VHVELARHFETTTTTTTEEENELINEVLKYEKQDWRRIRGTVQEPVEYFEVLAKGKSMLHRFGRFKTTAKSFVGVAPDSPLGKIVRTSTSNASDSPLGKVARTISSTKSPVGANTDDFVEGAWGKATTNVDISAERCLAYFWHHMNYEGNAAFEKDNGRLLKMQVDVPDSHTMVIANSTKSPFPGVDSRVYSSTWAWRREEDGGFVAGITSKSTLPHANPRPTHPHPNSRPAGTNEYVERAIEEDERAAGCTRGNLLGFWRFTPLAANACRATLVFQATAGGSIPVRAMNWAVKSFLNVMEVLRDKYERNGKAVDAELRGAFPRPPLLQHLNDEQTRIARSCMALETGSASMKWTKLASPSPFVENAMTYTKPVGSEAR